MSQSNDDLFESIISVGFYGTKNVPIANSDKFNNQLARAVERGDAKLTERLLDKGADPSYKINGRKPILNLTIENPDASHYRCAELLLEYGADVDATDEDGHATLYYACTCRDKEYCLRFVDLLIRAGVNVNLKTGNDDYSTTPLIATMNVHEHHDISGTDRNDGYALRIIRLLLEAGADPNAQDSDGVTPLHIAAIHNFLECAKLLLESGADPSIRDHIGHLPDKFGSSRSAETNNYIRDYRDTPYIKGAL